MTTTKVIQFYAPMMWTLSLLLSFTPVRAGGRVYIPTEIYEEGNGLTFSGFSHHWPVYLLHCPFLISFASGQCELEAIQLMSNRLTDRPTDRADR